MKIGLGRHRAWRPRMLGILLVLVAVTGLAPRPTAAAWTAASEPSDLAAMVLTPADLAAVGLDGYGVAAGATASPEAVVAAVAFQRDVPDDEMRARFEDAGLARAYELRLELPAAAGDGVARAVTSTIYRFADEEGAAAGLTILTDRDAFGTRETVEAAASVGDAAVVIRHRGTTPEPYRALDLAFRAGDLTAVVRLADFTGEEPALADAERLAVRLLDRIESALDGEASGLSVLTLRLGGDGVIHGGDFYTVDGGEYRRSIDESPAEAAAEAEARAEVGMVAEFMVSQRIAIADEPAEDAYLYALVKQFASANAAAADLDGVLDRAAAADEFENLRVLKGLTEYGDEAIAYTQTFYWAAHDVDLVYQNYYLRVGAQVAEVTLIAPEAQPLTILKHLAAAQASCLEARACPAVTSLPAALRELVESAGDDQIEPALRHAADLRFRERTWSGETFGVELTYDAGVWEALPREALAAAPTVAGDDVLALVEDEAQSVLTLSAFAGTDGADACVDGWIAGYAADEARGAARPVLDGAEAPVAGGDAERAYAAYGLRLNDGRQTFAYVECRSFAAGEAMLLIFHVGPLDDYAARAESREALLIGLELPGA